jgi:hypothetical protein
MAFASPRRLTEKQVHEFVSRHLEVVGDFGQHRRDRTDAKGIMPGNGDVMLAALDGRQVHVASVWRLIE